MELTRLVDLYYSKVSSSLPREAIEKQLAWLTNGSWSSESIFFSINYASRYYQSELEESLKDCLDNNRLEMIKYYMLAKAKHEVKHAEESDSHYDPRNTIKRADKPKWLRKSIDFNLFE